MNIVNDIRKYATKHGVKLSLEKSQRVVAKGETCECNGYFDAEDKLMVVAIDKPKNEWLPILIHESCHLDQFIDNNYLWQKWSVGYTMFFDWLGGGVELDNKTLKLCAQDIIDCEKDCEMRTIKKIKKYNLDINVRDYIRGANIYLYSFKYMMLSKKWKDGIYLNKELISHSPSTFQKSYMIIPNELNKLFTKFYKD